MNVYSIDKMCVIDIICVLYDLIYMVFSLGK